MMIGGITREAWRNVTSGTTRAPLFALALSVCILGPLCSDLAVANQIVTEAAQFQSAGGSILTIAAPNRIEGTACENLAKLKGVQAAGALRDIEDSPIRPLALPSSPIPLKEVTSGFPQLLTSSVWPAAGIMLSAEASQPLGLEVGDTLISTDGRSLIIGEYAYADDGRRPGFGYAALAITRDSKPYDECWVKAWPQLKTLPALLLTTLTPDVDSSNQNSPVLAQLNSRFGTTFDGPKRFQTRVTLIAAPLAGILAFAIGGVSVRIRRVELASALHARISKRAILSMLLIETTSWLVPVVLAGIAITAVIAGLSGAADKGAFMWLGVRTVAIGVVGVLLGITLSVGATQERHLFRYFKDR